MLAFADPPAILSNRNRSSLGEISTRRLANVPKTALRMGRYQTAAQLFPNRTVEGKTAPCLRSGHTTDDKT